MTIASAFNEITENLGGTPSTSGTIAGAIDALNDTLAGSDQSAAMTIEGAIRLLGENIGGGGNTGLSVANVTFVNTGSSNYTFDQFPYIVEEDGKRYISSDTFDIESNSPTTLKVVLLDSSCWITLAAATSVTVSGNAEYDSSQGIVNVMGDCTITAVGTA